MTDISRRDFVGAGVLAGIAATATSERAGAQAPALRRGSAKPVVIASGNGNQFKNGGDRTCVEEAFRLLLDCRRRTDLAERRDRMDMDRMGRDVAAKGTVDPVRVPRVPGGAVERDRR